MARGLLRWRSAAVEDGSREARLGRTAARQCVRAAQSARLSGLGARAGLRLRDAVMRTRRVSDTEMQRCACALSSRVPVLTRSRCAGPDIDQARWQGVCSAGAERGCRCEAGGQAVLAQARVNWLRRPQRARLPHRSELCTRHIHRRETD